MLQSDGVPRMEVMYLVWSCPEFGEIKQAIQNKCLQS